MAILCFPIFHNSRCLPQKFAYKLLLWKALGNMQILKSISQQQFKQNIWGEREHKQSELLEIGKWHKLKFLIMEHHKAIVTKAEY